MLGPTNIPLLRSEESLIENSLTNKRIPIAVPRLARR